MTLGEVSVFDNNVLLITGGTGSFGKTILKRFLDTGEREIRIFSRDEKKQEDLRLKLKNSKVKFFIGNNKVIKIEVFFIPTS